MIKWELLEDAVRSSKDRQPLVEGLTAELGSDKRPQLEQLPLEELRYLSWRWDLWPRYRDGRLGSWLLAWNMSAVERGRQALAEMEACGLADLAGATALDVGCGDGGFLVAMARSGAQAHGVDMQEHNIIGARMRAGSWQLPVAATVGSAMALPYSADSFDAVTCGDVIEHLSDPAAALGEIRRVLRPGGYFWLAAPTRFHLQHLRSDPHHHRFGVSVLPPKLAVWYLVRVRRVLPTRDRYRVERLPTYCGTVALLRRLGFEILAGEYRPLAGLREPSRIETAWKRRLLGVLVAMKLRVPLTAVFALAAELRHTIRLVCRKPGG